jgi:NAD(P)-dependent dehydrogenase (short-subunit alcohol dehydrogenase family)
MRSLAADLAGTGITANAVCPGSTRGTMLDASAAVYGLSSPEEFAAQQLVERLLEPEETAGLIEWLCGPASGGVTGAALPVDGGMTTS